MFNGRRVLVTGGTGMIGRPLVLQLLLRGAKVRIASLDDPSRAHPEAEFQRADLTRFENCMAACSGVDYVFHLAGIKGSPAMTRQRPASFLTPIVCFNTHMLEAARLCKVQRYLFTSSVGVYAPAQVLREDDVWQTFPSQNDWFPGWAKRLGELQVEAYRQEYDWKDIYIVRPANVYGPFDNFDPDNAMVVPSLIRRAMDGENPLVVWGDGSPIRDFIHAWDVAAGMVTVFEKGCQQPVNLGSGTGVTIRELVEIIVDNLPVKPSVIWDSTKPSGDKKRIMDTTRARSLGIEPPMSFKKGVKETMEWYGKNRHLVDKRFNIFKEKA